MHRQLHYHRLASENFQRYNYKSKNSKQSHINPFQLFAMTLIVETNKYVCYNYSYYGIPKNMVAYVPALAIPRFFIWSYKDGKHLHDIERNVKTLNIWTLKSSRRRNYSSRPTHLYVYECESNDAESALCFRYKLF